jgi:hypothetical protein
VSLRAAVGGEAISTEYRDCFVGKNRLLAMTPAVFSG